MSAEYGTTRSQRLIATCLAAALIIGSTIWIAGTMIGISSSEEIVERQQGLLANLDARVEQAGIKSGDGPAPGQDLTRIYLAGDTIAVSGAGLQQSASQIIESAEGRIQETQIFAEGQSDPEPGRVDLRVSFEITNDGLQKVLHRMETGLPFLTVRSLTIRPVSARSQTDDDEPPLKVEVVVAGHRKTADP